MVKHRKEGAEMGAFGSPELLGYIQQERKCKKCGTVAQGNFCPNCGAPVAAVGTGKGWAIPYFILAALFLAFFIFSAGTANVPAWSVAPVGMLLFSAAVFGFCILAGLKRAITKRGVLWLKPLLIANSIVTGLSVLSMVILPFLAA